MIINWQDYDIVRRIIFLKTQSFRNYHSHCHPSSSIQWSRIQREWLQSLWLEDGVNYDALMMARCSVCSAQGYLCPPHVQPRRPSFPHVMSARVFSQFWFFFVSASKFFISALGRKSLTLHFICSLEFSLSRHFTWSGQPKYAGVSDFSNIRICYTCLYPQYVYL